MNLNPGPWACIGLRFHTWQWWPSGGTGMRSSGLVIMKGIKCCGRQGSRGPQEGVSIEHRGSKGRVEMKTG